MLRSLNILFAFAVCGAQEPHTQPPASIEARQTQRQTLSQDLPRVLPLMREYRGVKLGMNRVDVKAAMDRTARAGMDWDEFRLGGSDLMTVRYDDKDAVKTIQLYFTNPAHAPVWTEVVGSAEIQGNSTGSKYARAMNKEENFWVTMFQSKTGAVTTITLSR